MIQDMTEGSPFKIIWSFSMPMLLSMVFQQFYNIVDSVVAGHFVGVDALAAVGASYPITFLFIAIASGAAVGCSVVVAQIFGAKQFTMMKSAVSTAIISLVTLALVLTLVGLLTCNPLMRLINTPANIFDDSALYLRIYIFGIIFLFLYNTATAIFNGLGDSRTPLYFLIFSSLLNIVLDLWFVISFGMGVAGVAWATLIAQGVSSVLAVTTLLLRLRKIHATEPYRRFDPELMKNMSRIALPSIAQQSFISVGQLCVQGVINGFGSETVAGYSAAFKLNSFAVSSMITTGNALSSYVAQNFGAGKLERVYKGFRATLVLTYSFVVVVVAVLLLFGQNLIGLFVDTTANPKVLEAGLLFLRITAPFYFVLAAKTACDGILRGTGAMREFMLSTFSDLILRVLLSFFLAAFIAFAGICWSYPIGWVVGTAFSVYFVIRGNWKKLTHTAVTLGN